ncbi:unnamed protein product [Spodoptera exigua]|nr:unnamed protein product [Spodoptera exigua]
MGNTRPCALQLSGDKEGETEGSVHAETQQNCVSGLSSGAPITVKGYYLVLGRARPLRPAPPRCLYRAPYILNHQLEGYMGPSTDTVYAIKISPSALHQSVVHGITPPVEAMAAAHCTRAGVGPFTAQQEASGCNRAAAAGDATRGS